ncbi:MAG: TIGR03790 family protein [Rubrivivax sp.]|nr:TIGR03790 family protein [Rubrivivax sp.]
MSLTGFCIAKFAPAFRNAARPALMAAAGCLMAAAAQGQVPASQSTTAPLAAASSAPAASWVTVPRLQGRLQAADLGLVINTADSASVTVGEYYIAARGLKPEQVLRLSLPVKPTLTREEFERLRQAIEAFFGPSTQALALAWAAPYAVECNAITGALALGFDAALCSNTCAASRRSGYFNSASTRPLQEPGWRPSMLLAAPTVEAAKALIDRGVKADGSRVQGRVPAGTAGLATALLLDGPDAARGVRALLYPPSGLPPAFKVDLRRAALSALPGAPRLLLALAGAEHPPLRPAPQWLPGGLGDHLTSWGGDLQGTHGQSTALDWIASGATASHGAVSEPCNYLQKFPHPQLLLLHYLQGATAIEAYWKSVAWPQQSLFIGEPLAAPFAPR